ncbi:hypothetical protein GGX14DRAFT_392916 [Mycena pura]|uniref:Uncharacterized protein n=1 Tax=Mycena pura TaxID=153505 RepID=A0AAD6YDG4_9AGAR|nr:hypothetical protein GGX14DRAFT_392916 [Mycena pura]
MPEVPPKCGHASSGKKCIWRHSITTTIECMPMTEAMEVTMLEVQHLSTKAAGLLLNILPDQYSHRSVQNTDHNLHADAGGADVGGTNAGGADAGGGCRCRRRQPVPVASIVHRDAVQPQPMAIKCMPMLEVHCDVAYAGGAVVRLRPRTHVSSEMNKAACAQHVSYNPTRRNCLPPSMPRALMAVSKCYYYITQLLDGGADGRREPASILPG